MAGLWEVTHGRKQSLRKEAGHYPAAGHLCLPRASRHHRGIAGLHRALPAASQLLCPGVGTAPCHSRAVKPRAPLALTVGLSCGPGEWGHPTLWDRAPGPSVAVHVT